MSFSENGTWFASAVKGQTSVSIWDLRKTGKAAETKVLEVGSTIENVCWDYSGQFLATAGPSGITVQHYAKSSKSWSEPLKSAVPAVAIAWGSNAQCLAAVDSNGVITILEGKQEDMES
jgi:pre-mRNA-processing factor 19